MVPLAYFYTQDLVVTRILCKFGRDFVAKNVLFKIAYNCSKLVIYYHFS